jgi:hypothetical protein
MNQFSGAIICGGHCFRSSRGDLFASTHSELVLQRYSSAARHKGRPPVWISDRFNPRIVP